jgi:hypothetical protein
MDKGSDAAGKRVESKLEIRISKLETESLRFNHSTIVGDSSLLRISSFEIRIFGFSMQGDVPLETTTRPFPRHLPNDN